MPINRLSDGTYLLDYTTLSTFQLCQKKCEIRFVRDIVPRRVAPALGFGGAIHSGLAAFYRGLPREEVIDLVMSEASGKGLLLSADEDPKRSVESAVAVIERYMDFYANDIYEAAIGPGGVPLVEVPHRGYLLDDPPIIYVMIVDLVARKKTDGSYHVMEHKTTSAITSDYMLQVRPNNQLTGNIWGISEMLGVKVESGILNAILVAPLPKDPSRSRRRPEDFFARATTTRSAEEIADWLADTRETAKDLIYKLEHGGRWVKNAPFACHVYNGCTYRVVCGSLEDQAVIENLYTTEAWELDIDRR